jgi:small subunit ribosomal protein S17
MKKQEGQRMKRIGTVVSDKMDKTIVVKVERKMSHSLYQRTMKKSKKMMAHDEKSQAKIGDRVEIIESRPLSSRKRWRLARVLDTNS